MNGPRMKLEIYSKTFALVAERTVVGDGVPRVGEFVLLPADVADQAQGLTHALVHEVTWECLGDRLTAVVACHATGHKPSNRLLRLEEQGWLHPRD
jgi:hypothetical protein